MARLQGRNALVTGGARGLGEAQCRALAGEGARVIIADIDTADALAACINEEAGHAMGLGLDVTSETRWDRAMALAVEELGTLDMRVNNAGTAALGSAEDTTLEDWRRPSPSQSAAAALPHSGVER